MHAHTYTHTKKNGKNSSEPLFRRERESCLELILEVTQDKEEIYIISFGVFKEHTQKERLNNTTVVINH